MNKPIVVNGIGKCGTTIMYDFLSKYYIRKPFITNLSKATQLGVYKTHTPIPNSENDIKVLYMFGNVYNTIVSFYNSWVKHGSKGKPNNGVLKNMQVNDKNGTPFNVRTFDFSTWVKNWYKHHRFPVMFVRYETMHENSRQIMDFCGMNNVPTSHFIPYKKRKTNWENCNKTQINKLVELYELDYNFINSLPDIKIL